MGQTELLVDFMLKRAMSKSLFSIQNYKDRWFVLTEDHLSYYAGTLGKRGKIKGSIAIANIKIVEGVEDEQLDEWNNVFQIMHRTDKGEYHTLYIVAQNDAQQKKWIETMKNLCKAKGVAFLPKYHTGVWTRSIGHYNCCDQIDRQSPGCRVIDSTLPKEVSPTSLNSPPPGLDRVSGSTSTPVPLPRPDDPISKEKKIYVAAYDYKPNEDGDLELITGSEYEILDDTQDHWWLAKNSSGDKGYIPANYVKKKFELEIYEWYYKGVTRERSETLLKEEKKEGCFMVRDSSTVGMYTLSLYTNEGKDGMVRHYHIKKNEQDRYYLAEKHSFVTIPDLIYYHKHNAGGIASRLRCPPMKSRSIVPVTAGFGHSKWELDRQDLEICEVLGSGCFGTVHKGMWKTRIVAAKMMKENTMSEDAFLEEAKTMTQLSHTNLVQLYGVVTRSKPLIIITELMQNGALLTYLKRHKIRLINKETTLVDMCIQVCAAMEYLESRSFIHRDLAARNCLVGENQIIKVADFGLARYVIDDEYTSSMGTKFPVKWAPPEVLSYTRFSSKSDVWAFGVLMWEVFTCGQMPYENMRNAEVVDFVCHENKRLPKPEKSTQKTYQIMMKCWHKDPDQRPTFSQLHQTLTGLLEIGNYPQV